MLFNSNNFLFAFFAFHRLGVSLHTYHKIARRKIRMISRSSVIKVARRKIKISSVFQHCLLRFFQCLHSYRSAKVVQVHQKMSAARYQPPHRPSGRPTAADRPDRFLAKSIVLFSCKVRAARGRYDFLDACFCCYSMTREWCRFPDVDCDPGNNADKPVSYTHLTLPTKRIV